MIQVDELPPSNEQASPDHGQGRSSADPGTTFRDNENALHRGETVQPGPHHQGFLLGLSDRLGDLDDPQAIVAAALEALGSYLQIDLAGFGEVDGAQEQIVTRQEWSAKAGPGNLMPLRLGDFQGGAEELKAGRTLRSAGSVPGRPRADNGPFSGASVTVPLLQDGRLVALLYLRQDGGRSWTKEELALAENVARRIGKAADRARNEATLRESEARFRVLADAQPALVWIVDPALKLVYANARWRAFSGLPAEQALGYSWKDSVHPDDVAGIVGRVEAMRGQEVAFSFEMRYRTIAGEYRWHMIQAEPVRTARGELSAWFGASVDIHDQKLAEAALRESEERLALAQRAARIGVFDWDVPTSRVTWTAEQERLFGLEPGTFEGNFDGWASRVLPEGLRATNETIADAVARGDRETEFAYEARLPDGSIRCIQGVCTIVYAPDGSPLRIVGVNIDITERKDAEERQHLLIRELHHRVKNTLATVQAIVSSTARTASSIDAFYQGFVGRIISLARTHNLLTEDYWQKVSLEELLHNELEPYKDCAGERVSIEGASVELTSEAAVPIGMAIHELTTNAAKHGALSVSAGRVDVRWTTTEASGNPMLNFFWTESGGPAVVLPTRQGFGSRLLQRVLTTQLQAEVQISFDPDGLRFSMAMPLPKCTALLNPRS